MQPANRIAVNTGYLYAKLVITVFISLYTTRLVLGALGANDFGIFNLIGGVIAMLTFLNTSMASATQRFMSYSLGAGDADRQHAIFNVSVVLHFFIAILVVLLLELSSVFLFHGIFNIPTNKIGIAKAVFQFMVASTFFTIISVPYDAIINANENMLLVTILGLVESFLKLAIAIYITKTSFDKLVAYGLLTTILSVFLLIIRRVYCSIVYTEAKIRLRKYFRKPLFREMIGYAGWNFLGSSSSMIAGYGQGIVINIFFGTSANAAQGISSQISGQLGAFASTMMQALNPIIDKSEGAGDRGTMLKASIMGSKVSFFLLIFFFVPFMSEASYILKIWLKVVPPFVVVFCELLLVRNLVDQLFVTLTSSIAAVGNIKRFQIVSSIIMILPLLITWFFYRLGYPVYTIYTVFLIFAVIKSLNILYFSYQTYNLPVLNFLREVVLKCTSVFLFSILLTSIPTFIMPPGIIRLLVVIIVSFLSSSMGLWFWGFTKTELAGIKQIVNKMLQNILKSKKSLVV